MNIGMVNSNKHDQL